MNRENELLKSASRGDMNAFRELVEANKKKVYYTALNFTGNHQSADDISQEVFLKLYRSLKNFRGDSQLSTWLYRVTVNTCISSKRKKTLPVLSIEENIHSLETGESLDITGTAVNSPEKALEKSELKKHIEKALKNISNKERIVFILRHYRDLSLKEISEIMDISEGTVKSLLFRSVKKLRKKLSFYKNHVGTRHE